LEDVSFADTRDRLDRRLCPIFDAHERRWSTQSRRAKFRIAGPKAAVEQCKDKR